MLGTRLVASLESGAHEVYKQGIVAAEADEAWAALAAAMVGSPG